ncbi:TetR/AcrR family transcriptional regulator [Janibacter alkaliphilus]|uniref:AcrR family transcriptional regulator n=1 Tax=Janibacter alkaliphilus TaxID=1069963 RepID=A0A852XAI5_9MICO|nr:TetR/AcrR family transcriptional regulator [Janibacter alkaliphilus]NYG38550.1 AcrR family transcriptional regulator [Janibacter alkaliphilus]
MSRSVSEVSAGEGSADAEGVVGRDVAGHDAVDTAQGSASTPYHHGNLRQALLDAALELLVETPATRLSLRQVARAAGVSHGAPYHHFADKDALVAACGTESLRRLAAHQHDSVAGQDDPRERLLAFGRAYLDFAVRRPSLFALVFDPELCDPADPKPENIPYLTQLDTELAEVVAEGQRAGLLPAGPTEEIAHALWGTVHGLALLVSAGHLSAAQAEAALVTVVRD